MDRVRRRAVILIFRRRVSHWRAVAVVLADDQRSVLTFFGSNQSTPWPDQNCNSVSKYDSN
jgi:hypothetical protein